MDEKNQELLEIIKQFEKGTNQRNFNKQFIQDFFDSPAIYFLCHEDENNKQTVVYVGKSTAIGYRICQHKHNLHNRGEKDFNFFGYIIVPEKYLDELEKIFIAIYNPKYNVSGKNWYSDLIHDYAGIGDRDRYHSEGCISFETVKYILEHGFGSYVLNINSIGVK